MNILCIETSTTVCSVCVANEKGILAMREINEGYTHAENLHVFIEEILKEARVSMKELNAVAVSKGPGSYTGLRIGVSAAKGLCYALNIPLVSVDTLQAMTTSVVKEDILYCPMLDARRMEVYCGVFDKNLKAVVPVQALVLDENTVSTFKLGKPICFFGEGMPKAKELLQSISGAIFADGVVPSSQSIASLATKKFANKEFENTALFEPFYLKDFFINKR